MSKNAQVLAFNFNALGPSFCPYSVNKLLRSIKMKVESLLKVMKYQKEPSDVERIAETVAILNLNRLILYYFWVLQTSRRPPKLRYLRTLSSIHIYKPAGKFRAESRAAKNEGDYNEESDRFVFKYLLSAKTSDELLSRLVSISIETTWSSEYDMVLSNSTLK